ncbi:MAG: alpha/beta fold hydrolase [Pseudomonadota bacterium]
MYDPQSGLSSSLPLWLGWMMAQAPLSQTMFAPGFGKDLPQVDDLPKLWQKMQQDMQGQFKHFARGLHTYQQAPHDSARNLPPVVWQQGATKLYDYGKSANKAGPAMLVVPSHVNRSYILDLKEDLSVLRYWAEQGFRPFLVDWGDLSDYERDYSLDDYFQNRLEPMLHFVQEISKQPINVVGYCMGGMLATALALRHPEIASLVLMATPWDFHVGREWLPVVMQQSSCFLESLIDVYQELPVEVIQMLFASLNPPGVMKKFAELGQDFQNTAFVQNFVEVEDWLNDCVPLAPKVAKDCLLGWYRDNLPHRNQWKIQGQSVIASEIKIPTFGVVPKKDTIVSPDSSRALLGKLPHVQSIEPPLGHIGLVTSKSAPELVWEPIAQFLKTTNPS